MPQIARLLTCMLLCVKFEESTPKIARYNGGNSYEREGLQGVHCTKTLGRNNGGDQYHLPNTYNVVVLCTQNEAKRKAVKHIFIS